MGCIPTAPPHIQRIFPIICGSPMSPQGARPKVKLAKKKFFIRFGFAAFFAVVFIKKWFKKSPDDTVRANKKFSY